MLFNSYIFVLLFLPLTVAGYFLLNKCRTSLPAHLFLLGMSLWFYGYFNISYLPIILASVLVNYFLYKVMAAGGLFRTLSLIAALIFNIGILFYYKYFDFFTENINALFGSDLPLRHLILPLGISFFTFQQLSFVIDAWKGEVEDYRFLDYALFVTYFPQLIAGPIVTHDELVPQFRDEGKRQIDWDNVAAGLYLFAMGLGKKVLVADTFGNAANWGFANIPELNSLSAFLVSLSYTIQIYFDFSGYCDMAIGIGRMMNIELPANFDSPYRSRTILEFWERWHMTLTRFFRKYVYIPLGGNRRGKSRTYLNMMIVYLVSGIWHGANWTFILWGVLHGAFCVFTRCNRRMFDKLPDALNWLITFLFVNLAWVLFRADSIRDAVHFLMRFFVFSDFRVASEILDCFRLPELEFAGHLLHIGVSGKMLYLFAALFFAISFWLIGRKNSRERMDAFRPCLASAAVSCVLLTWCVISFSGVSTFLYFNF